MIKVICAAILAILAICLIANAALEATKVTLSGEYREKAEEQIIRAKNVAISAIILILSVPTGIIVYLRLKE